MWLRGSGIILSFRFLTSQAALTLLEDLLLWGTLWGHSGRDQVSACHFRDTAQGKKKKDFMLVTVCARQMFWLTFLLLRFYDMKGTWCESF